MKSLLIHSIGLISLVSFGANGNDYNFFPNLPAGVYKAVYRAIIQCNKPHSYELQFNSYLSKKTAVITEMKGNVTANIPLDDSLDLQVNFAVKNSIGGWNENAFIYKKSKACSTAKEFLRKSWPTILEGFGIHNSSACPIPVNIYKSAGVNTELFHADTKFPKIFFYGSYKAKIYFTKENKVMGCIIFVVDFKRLWEND